MRTQAQDRLRRGHRCGALALTCAWFLIACSASAQPPDGDPFPLPAGVVSGEWALHGRGFAEQRYSPLEQIHTGNVAQLGLAWTFDDFVVRGRTHRGTQATPLMRDGVLYFTGPWSVVYAVDAESGAVRWTHDPQVDGAWARHACCDAVNRGVVLWKDMVYVATLDGWLVALDARTGEPRWRVDTLVDRSRSYTITGAPRLAGGNIVIGNGGAEMGVRGYVSAYDAASGRLAWRFYTVPGAGPDEHPEVGTARKSWSPRARWDLGGGGTVWDSMTYDPELDLLYVGVGNGGPWPVWVRNAGERPDNLFLSSILAIEARSGRLAWYYQTTPADSWDYTATQNMILADLRIGGRLRKVLMQAPKNGFFYVLDRASGELLAAEKYTQVTWAERIDRQTGRPVVSESALYAAAPRTVWPSTAGGHNWQPMAYSPQRGWVYIPTLEMPMTFSTQQGDVHYLPGANNVGASAAPPPERVQRSVLKAWDPVAGRIVWQSAPLPWWGGGVLTTAGGLVLQGSADGVLTAYDAASGRILKKIETGLAIMAPPMSYEIAGRQYIAVLAGLGGAMNGRFHAGFAALEYRNHERLFVFALGGRAVDLPPRLDKVPQRPLATGLPADADTVALGRQRYLQFCARCHAPRSVPNGYPDLWNLPPALYAAFDSIVLGGAMSYAGMAGFADVLTPQDTLAIRAFIVADQQEMRRNPSAKPPEQGTGH